MNNKLASWSLTFSGYAIACDYQIQDGAWWLWCERLFWRVLSDIVGVFVDWDKWPN